MASSLDYVQYVVAQMEQAGSVTYKRMFGEYGIYLDGIFIGAICDNQLFFKVSEEARKLLIEETLAPMYKGAKPSFLIEQVDNRDYLCDVAIATKIALEKTPKKKNVS